MLVERSNNSRLSFVNKCLSIPVVNSTCNWLNSSYKHIKCQNFLVKCALDLAESTVKTSIQIASPFVERFKDKVIVIDEIACHLLDKLEATFPIITQETNEIVNNFNKKVQPTVDRLNELKNSKNKLVKNLKLKKKEYDRLILHIARRILDLSENFIEDKFHESINETEALRKNEINNDDLVKRAKLISNLLYVGVQRKCFKQINHLIKNDDKYLNFLIKLLEFVEKLKDFAIKMIYERILMIKNLVGIYKEYLMMISKQLLVQDGRSINSVNSLEEKTKIVVRRSLGNIHTVFYLLYSRLCILPKNFRSSFVKFSEDFSTFCKHYEKDEQNFDNKLFKEIKFILNKAELSVYYLIKNFTDSSMVSSMVPNFDAIVQLDQCDDELMCTTPKEQLEMSQSTPSPISPRLVDSSTNTNIIPNEFFSTSEFPGKIIEDTNDESEIPNATSSLNSSSALLSTSNITVESKKISNGEHESNLNSSNTSTKSSSLNNSNVDLNKSREESTNSSFSTNENDNDTTTETQKTKSEVGSLY